MRYSLVSPSRISCTRFERRLCVTVHSLLRESLLDGRDHAAMLDGSALGIQVLADQGYSTYVAVRIIGSVPRRLVATILSLIPGCQLDAWMSDYAMPERPVAPEEQIWSNMMDPTAAAKLLEEDSLEDNAAGLEQPGQTEPPAMPRDAQQLLSIRTPGTPKARSDIGLGAQPAGITKRVGSSRRIQIASITLRHAGRLYLCRRGPWPVPAVSQTPSVTVV